jgi:hypothetical protein
MRKSGQRQTARLKIGQPQVGEREEERTADPVVHAYVPPYRKDPWREEGQ